MTIFRCEDLSKEYCMFKRLGKDGIRVMILALGVTIGAAIYFVIRYS
jgi:hypothetical protein